VNDYYSGMPLKGHPGYIFIMEDCPGDKSTILVAYIPNDTSLPILEGAPLPAMKYGV